MTARYGAGAEADSGAGGGSGGGYIRSFLFFFSFLSRPFLLFPSLLFSSGISLNSQLSTFTFICQRGCRVAGGELRHLAGSPGGGGGIRVLSYSSRVHTV